MNTDYYFEIGSAHTTCQDYAMSGSINDISYAIVSDGCSSSKDTDLGARILAHSAKDTILYLHSRKQLYDVQFIEGGSLYTIFKELVLKKSLEVKNALGLIADVLDATLLVTIGVGPHFRINLGWGDGWFITKRNSGLITVKGLTFKSKAPYYLSYDMFVDKRDGYQKIFGSTVYTKWDYNIGKDYNNSTSVDSIGYEDCNIYDYTIEDPVKETNRIKQIIVTSDGLGSYKYDTKENKEDIDMVTLIPEFVNYPVTKGTFIQRRMGNRIRREHKEKGIIHWDDISFAGINF